MKARFLHFADCHLGYKQYNNADRYNDFARAFLHVIDTAVAEAVDFVVLAGDLFQKRAIDALTLNQAIVGLERLQRAGIPCLAVEGNHEHAYYLDQIGWMEFLAQRRLLILLDAHFEAGSPQLAPYAGRKGSYFDPVPGLRVHGLRYRGSSTATAVAAYADTLAEYPDEKIDYTIFIAHAGMEGVLAGQAGGLSYRQWSVLAPYVDYLALGHIHKPFEFEDWIYNPGSPESCSIAESAWRERGYYLVEVDTGSEHGDAPKHSAKLHANPRRLFHRLSVKVDLHTTPEALASHVEEVLKRRARDLAVDRLPEKWRPVVELQLTGVLPVDRQALDLRGLEVLVDRLFSPLVTLVKNVTRDTEFSGESEEGLSRGELERRVIDNLLTADARFAQNREQWTQLALTLKSLAIGGASPEAILAELSGQIDAIESASGDHEESHV